MGVIGWLVIAGFSFGYYEGDLASAILGLLSLAVGALGAYCLGRAVDARGERVGFLWAGRALALAGVAVAIAFPAILYGEIVQLIHRAKPQTYDMEAAIWYQFRVMPLTVVPALVALRWGRIAAVLFILVAVYSVADGLVHFGGVNYFPEGASGLGELLLTNAPAFLTAALLLAGSESWRGDKSARFAGGARPTTG